MLAGHAREKLTAQVKDAAERVSQNFSAVLGLQLIAIALSAAALYVSLKYLKAARG